MKFASIVAGAFLLAGSMAAYAQDAAEVDAVVAAVKAKNKDFKALCQGGADAIRKAATESTTELARTGKLKGNPAQVGGAAGQKLGSECRG